MSPSAPAKKPRIVICADPFNEKSADIMRRKIEKAGGDAFVIKAYSALVRKMRQEEFPLEFERIDGLIIMGNDRYDIAPETYISRFRTDDPNHLLIHPQTRSESKGPAVVKDRALLERYLIREALLRKIPLLGICGGMQRINIECGQERPEGGTGTLRQSLFDYVGDHRHNQEKMGHGPHDATQQIMVAPETELHRLLEESDDHPDPPGYKGTWVSTRHNQAVYNPAKGLMIAAHTDEKHATSGQTLGIIKAIEADPNDIYRDHFIVGVQFHPEYVRGHHLADSLSARLVEKAIGYARVKPHESKYPGKVEKARMSAVLDQPGIGVVRFGTIRQRLQESGNDVGDSLAL